MRNTLGDLNNHLFEQLERLNDDELIGEDLSREIKRANAISTVASQIISNGELVLKAQRHYDNDDRLNIDAQKPRMLEG